jgi:hypothetical protein
MAVLTGAGLSFGQSMLDSMPPSQSTVVPATASAVEPAHKPQRIITVEEPGHPPAKCRILKAWHMPDGGMAREVQDIDTGEIMTIADSGPVTTAQTPGSAPRLHEVSSRIFHWGRSSTPPPGVPLPPEAVMGSFAQASPAPPMPAAPVTASVAQPSDWRQSWGNAGSRPAPGSSNSYATPPGQAPLPRTDYSANVPGRPSTPSLEYPTRPGGSYTAQAPGTSRTGSLFASAQPRPENAPGVKAVVVSAPAQPQTVTEDSPAVKAAIAAAAAVPAKPATVTATVVPSKPATNSSLAAAPKPVDLPKADSQRPDPLATPDRFSRKSADTLASTSKGAAPTQQAAASADKSPATPAKGGAPTQQAAASSDKSPATPSQQPATGGKALPAGAQSVLAAQGGNPGQICYLPVPVVTLPSGYRPQPETPRIPQAPRPIAPGPQIDPSMVSGNAFTPDGPPTPAPQQQVAMMGDMRNAFTVTPSGTPLPNNPAAMNAAAFAQLASRMPCPRPPMQNMYAQGWGAPGVPGPMAAGWPPQYMPPAAGMMPPAAQGMAYPYPPMAMAPAMPGANAPAGSAVTPVAYHPSASAGQLPPLPSEERLTESDAHNSMALFQLLKDSLYPSQREWAADNLAAAEWRANPMVVQALVTAAHDDPAPTVRVACVHSLAKLNAKSAPVLAMLQGLKADTDPRVRNEAEQALATLAQQTAKMPERAAGEAGAGTASVSN